MKLIGALGIDVRILLAQFFNFAILTFVLWRFAYRPVFNILEERRGKIEQGVKDAREASEKLAIASEESRGLVANAKKEAITILEEARAKAEVRYQEIVGKSREDIGVMINEEKKKIQTEKAQVLLDIKKEVADLVILSLEKILKDKIDYKQDKALIDKHTLF